MKYTHYNKETKQILGYYDDEIHTTIPTPNIEISDEAWQEAININATHVKPKTKELYKQEVVKSEDEILTEAKQEKLTRLEIWFDTMKNKSKIDLKGFGLIDGGYKYLLNARAIRNNYELIEPKRFRMWDDSFKAITADDIAKIERAIELAGIKLHAIKWSYEEAIANANSKEELDAISFNDTIEVENG
ncbi:hypothetical protein CCAL13119_09025 [Campylobacter sp. RM13119]|uniref:hypothetical protein n=1 Tax=Campylobacter californiensis TaxID=1032243 RepID=UPI001472837E|nr:hypothetical protein [Campylobacter sp. RM13119]MBE3607065.1 hypothetical protein [Campylobacter sp. RM13119]